MMISENKQFWFLTLGCVLVAVQGFVIFPQRQQQEAITGTSLFGRKRRGLGTIASDGGLTTTKKTTSIKQRSTRKKKGGKSTNKTGSKDAAPGGGISPDLENWLSSQEGGSDDNSALDVDDDIEDDEEDAVSFQTFEPEETTTTKSTDKQNNRRIKQSERKEIEEKRAARVSECIDSLEASLEESGNIDDVLASVKGLLQLQSESLRLLIAGKKRLNYRLAWVGSDDAITHIGTGLHKVPLARLQEVFMSFLGRNRMEVSEVIRILGPFPNVKNILQGDTKIMKNPSDKITTMNVVIDSMVDGTGKEILAGTDENVRRVDWHVYFADERVIVAVVPPKDGSGFRSNPLEDNGANVLVFVKEDELDKKLDALRVL